MANLHCEIPDEIKHKLDIFSATKKEDIKDVVTRVLSRFFKYQEKKEAKHDN